MFDDEIDKISFFDLFIGVVDKLVVRVMVFLKIYYVIFWEKIFDVIECIKGELKECKV